MLRLKPSPDNFRGRVGHISLIEQGLPAMMGSGPQRISISSPVLKLNAEYLVHAVGGKMYQQPHGSFTRPP